MLTYDEALELKRRYGEWLETQAGVAGLGVGRAPDGGHGVVVYLATESARQGLPAEIEGHPLLFRVSGGFRKQ